MISAAVQGLVAAAAVRRRSFSCMLVGSQTLVLQNQEMTNNGAH